MPSPDLSLVSAKKIPRRERLIFPLDVDTDDEALALVRELGDAVWFYKIGFQLLLGGHYLELVERLADAGKRVFVDLKLFDVPETVASAVRQLSRRRVDFVTVHANEGMLAAACEAGIPAVLLPYTVGGTDKAKDLFGLYEDTLNRLLAVAN